MQNPPPIATPDGHISPLGGEIDFRALARAQKWVFLWVVLSSILPLFLAVFALTLQIEGPPVITETPVDAQSLLTLFLIGFAQLFIVLLMAFDAYRLCRGLQNQWEWLAALSALVPLLNLVVLLRLNTEATSKLRAAGYRVGLMGARKS